MTDEHTNPDPLVRPGLANRAGALATPIAEADIGHAVLTPDTPVEAGSWQTLTLSYTCGRYGIDDSGALRVCWRFAADHTKPQFHDPAGPGFTTVTASNNAVLDYRYDMKGNVRPWDRTLAIRVVDGFMQEGDTVTIVFGDRSQGGPGMRMQTFCTPWFEFRTLVDPIATYQFQPVPRQPGLAILPAAPDRFVAHVPTLARPGRPFALKIKAEDVWGNPTDKVDTTLHLRASAPVEGLPATVDFRPGAFAAIVEGLSVATPGDVDITLHDAAGAELARANALRVADPAFDHIWADLHGQSAETIGTNTAEEYFAFARDRAFVDACCHQGNDFQMTLEFWDHLNRITAAFDEPGRFVAIPGYEWSGNTNVGGDRNVMFPVEGRTIRRSSHALIADHRDIDTDCATARDLFAALAEAGEWDAAMIAHCGGRYADIAYAHDGRFEKAIEIHSSWGTFEWLLHDAFDRGYRVGIVANSDGHKGRPGASYPGVSLFGAIGGLTCYLVRDLSRSEILEALAHRRHYATTGGPHGRMVIDVTARFDAEATIHHDDPAILPSTGTPAREARMGDIAVLPEGGLTLDLDILASAPIERVEVFNGRTLLKTLRTYTEADLANRLRVVWEGAKYRGRFRQILWDGGATFEGAGVAGVTPINFFNPARTLTRQGTGLRWQSVTTGNFAGFDAQLTGPGGRIALETGPVTATLDLDAIGFEDTVVAADPNPGVLPVFAKLMRLPERLEERRLTASLRIDALQAEADNPIFLRLTQTDGVRAWTSPIYVTRRG